MKILQIVAAYKPAYIYGGPTMSVSKLCEALNEAKIETEVMTTTANGKSELPVIPNQNTIVDGVNVIYFKRITKDHTHLSPALLRAVWKMIKAQKSNTLKSNIQKPGEAQLIIHIHAWWNLVSIFSCSLAKWYNIPVVLSPRGMLTAYSKGNRNAGVKGIIHNVMGKRLLAYSHIHTTSEQEKQDVLGMIRPKSITVIPNLVNLPSIEDRKNIIQQIPVSTEEKTNILHLIFLSRIEEKKGLELLFESLAKLGFNWQLTIAGNGQEDYVKSLKQKAENLKINANIDWLGHVNNENKFKLIAEHDLLVLSSYNENFANVVIESLSVGTPVLLSNQVGLASYVAEKKLGWITNLDANQIAKTLEEAFKDLQHRIQIRKLAPEIISTDFGDEQLVKQYINLYNHVLNE